MPYDTESATQPKKTALRLQKTMQDLAWSKMGGEPQLPADITWPEGPEGPLGFIAQIDLKEVSLSASLEDFPSAGRLYFFCDLTYEEGNNPLPHPLKWRVIYYLTSSLDSIPAISSATPRKKFREAFVTYHRFLTSPLRNRFEKDDYLMKEPLFNRFEDQWDIQQFSIFKNHPQHQLGGFPNPLEGQQMPAQCDQLYRDFWSLPSQIDAVGPFLKTWQLLFQVDSDPELNMHWGDSGRLYFWIHSQDLKQQDFSKVCLIRQSF